MGYKLDFNVAAVQARLNGRLERAQTFLDNEVLKDCAPYVPFRTGNLMMSGNRTTIVGSGEVRYRTPYARACYYAMRPFNTSFHPQASAQWFEKAKTAKKHAWLNGVQKIVDGG